MRKLLISFVILLLAAPAFAQWRRAALYGADVRALITDPTEPDTVYLGTSGGELYLSTDGGTRWTNPFHGVPFPGHTIDSLVVDRSGRLWAACWGLWGGGVIAVSDDHGHTWTRRDTGLEDFSVRAITVDPHDENLIVAGGLTGVYRSADGGESWQKISDQENVESVAIDPRTNSRIYVGTWRQGQRTEDGGKTWKLINDGMVLDTDMFSILIEPDNPDSLWVATCGWVYNSANRGDKWTRFRDGFDNRRIHDIEVDPCNRDALYAGSVAGLYRSDDRGKSWYVVSDEGLVVNSIALHPQRPDRVILGVEGDGVYVSNDGAKTFTRSSSGLYNVRITTIAADPASKDHVYAAVAFGGAASGIYRSEDRGVNWERVSSTKLPEVLSLSVAPAENGFGPKFVAGTERGFFTSDDAVTWVQSEPVNFPLRVEKVVRFNPARYFAATSEGVFTSRDGGMAWYRLGGAGNRTVDLAIGLLGESRALFALSESGVTVFDGENWLPIADAPTRGRTLAIRDVGGTQVVFVAGAQGVKAGHIDAEGRWVAADAPDAQYASVFGAWRDAHQLLYLTSRSQREMLVGEPSESDWLSVALPGRQTEVTSISPDPFDRNRIYVGTMGEGVYVYEGKAGKYVAAKKPSTDVNASVGSSQ
jgi:photosystem II stability/assembly factor-like uncharacterized protein